MSVRIKAKNRFERVTGLIFGTYRWSSSSIHGPRPWLWLGLRPGGTSWCRFEAGFAGRGFYLTWGQELTPGERVDNAMARVR